MTDSTLAALGAVATLNDADLLYVDDGPAVDGKCLASVLKTYVSLSPTLVTPALGVPVSGDISACTGGPTLTSPVFVTPALGTPASGVATNLTGTAAGLTAGNVTANANLTGHITSTGNAAILGSFTRAQLEAALSDLAKVGDVLADGTIPLTGNWDVGAFDVRSLSAQYDAGNAAGAVAQRFGADATEGYEIKVVDETLSGLSAISTDLTADIPDGAYILSVQANIETAVVAGGTSVKVGIGPIGDPDKYGITSAFTKNLKIDTIPAHAILSGSEDVQIHMCATGGGIGDAAASAGAVRVRMVYALPNSLADAA